MLHSVLTRAEAALGINLRVDGHLNLLERSNRRALLISRGERQPSPADPAIRATLAAADAALRSSEILVVGARRVHWDLALWKCRAAGGAAIVVLEDSVSMPEIVPDDALCVWPEPSVLELSKEARQFQRDRLAGLLATSAYSIRLRANGNMATIADEMKARGCPVDAWNLDGFSATRSHDRPPVEDDPIAAPLISISFADRLTHFTREPDGAWPGERYSEYLTWLSSGADFVPRDAFQALRRILSEKRIRACGRLIEASAPMVCFTQRAPAELLAENRWRKGLHRWTYSPYALSFSRDELTAFGARPVRYAARGATADVPELERGFVQIESSAGIDWRGEAEWRVRGDLDFSRIDPSHIVACVERAEEARRIEREFRIRALVIVPSKP